MNRIERTAHAIVGQTESLLASDAFTSWTQSENFRANDLVACNNSFLFREVASTVKNTHYIGMKFGDDGRFILPPVVITTKKRINVQFKRITPPEFTQYEVVDLESAISNQLPGLGSIIFSLVGRIGAAEGAEVELQGVTGVRTLRYAPNQTTVVKLINEAISLSNITDLDTAWTGVQANILESDVNMVELGGIFESAFHSLQEASARPIDLNDVSADAPSILGNVHLRIQEQVDAFSKALQLHRRNPEDNESYHELLRVAYNFADGVRSFFGLMVGICDLKPLIFWLTIFEQIELAHCFAKLPFSLVGQGKPSLARYRSVIAGARNQAFHDIFAFDHPFKVDLGRDAIRAPQLRIFRDYSKRNDPVLTFEDHSLVELLQALTRTPVRPVPLGFWDGNKEVMDAVVNAISAFQSALIILVDGNS